MMGLTEPLADLAAWTRYLGRAEIPVLGATASALELLREVQDHVSPAQLSPVIEADPFMTIRFLAYVASKRRDADGTLTETVLASLVLTGIAPFFAYFGSLPTVEDRLQDEPEAMECLLDLLARSERAGRFALAFSVHRADPDAAVVRQAASLYDFAEMLMWCHAPRLMLAVRAAQQTNPALRSAVAQRDILHVDLDKLRQQLFVHWRVPDLKTESVELAARLARHTTFGWNNPALPDDITQLAQLLHATPRVALAYVRKVDVD